MKVSIRKDLALDGEKVPAINLEGVSLDAYEVQEAKFLYQCDVTGQVALKDREGRLVVLYGIDLDFTEDEPKADEPGLYEVTVFKVVSSVESNYNSATEARAEGARLAKLYREQDPLAVEYFHEIAQHSDYCDACGQVRWLCICKGD
jgi:hypothetical protein